jgi:hypothetical protein
VGRGERASARPTGALAPVVGGPEVAAPGRQDAADPDRPAEPVEQGSRREEEAVVAGVAMVLPTSCAASAARSSRPRSTRTRPAARGSRERWSFASGSPQTDRSRRWRSSARPDPGSWTRPRRKRSAAPARTLSSEAGSACPSPIASISRITHHCQPPASKNSGVQAQSSGPRWHVRLLSTWTGAYASRGGQRGKTPCSLLFPCL